MHKLLPLLVIGVLMVLVVNIFRTHGLKVGAAAVIDDTPQTRNVLLLIFNPVLESKGGVKLTEYMNWSNPDTITNTLLSRFPVISHGYLTYNVSERQEIDGYFVKESGYEFTDDTFLSCIGNTGPCNGEGINYQKLFTDYDICNKNVDEVWLWGAPWFGYQEFNPVNYCGKTQFVMGFSYERQFDEAIHDFGHRMEFVGNTRVGNGNWQQNEVNDWNKFSMINGHCGNVHFPPGSNVPADEYIYDKTPPVTTDCEGYTNYPDGPFTPQSITCTVWGCTQGGYISWWLSHIPAKSGTTTTPDFKTVYNNWWKYYANYDGTLEPLPSPSGSPPATPVISFANLSSNLIPHRATFNFTYSGPTVNSYIVDMSITPEMINGTYLTFAQGSASPVVDTNPEKWASYTCDTQFWWTVKNAYGVSSIQPGVVDCSVPSPSPTLVPTPTPTVTPTKSPSPVPTRSPTITPRPSPTFVPTTSPAPLTIYSNADSYVSGENGKTKTNFGNQKSLFVDDSPNKIAFIKFDLASLSSKSVTNATLWLKVTDKALGIENLKQTSSSWTETGLTYSNKPALSTKISSFLGFGLGSWKNIDVTDYVKSNKGKVISFGIDSSVGSEFAFGSRESSDKPYILVK